jgi:hypothetical protein
MSKTINIYVPPYTDEIAKEGGIFMVSSLAIASMSEYIGSKHVCWLFIPLIASGFFWFKKRKSETIKYNNKYSLHLDSFSNESIVNHINNNCIRDGLGYAFLKDYLQEKRGISIEQQAVVTSNN